MCDCITLMNNALVDENTQIDIALGVKDGTFKVLGVEIAVHAIDKRRGARKPKQVIASHCPFCGEKYSEREV